MRYDYFVGPCVAAAAGFALGALAMYVFDPESGKRRRAVARDKTLSTVNDAMEGVKSTTRDLKNRAQGLAAEARGALSSSPSSQPQPPTQTPFHSS
jgi:gas vesicle protein